MTQISDFQICLRLVALWSLLCSLSVCVTCHASFDSKEHHIKAVHFDVPEGNAIRTLKEAAYQADVDILFPGRLIRKVHTPAIQGEYVPQEVFELMLAGTSLAVFQHEESGVYTIMKATSAASMSGDSIPKNTIPMKETEGTMTKKKKKWINILAVALTLGIGAGTDDLNAQDDDSSDDAFEFEKFVVDGGIALSRKKSIELKRVSPNSVDAISAEGLGRFPDENVAESLQRITGVQINRNRGEGRTVNIRGLPSNFTQVFFNGRTLSSALGAGPDSTIDRSFDFATLPSEFISTLKVHKTPTADMEEGGLSGTVDVETASAFDIGKRVGAASVQSAWESNSGVFSPRASLMFSDVLADGKVGFSLGLAHTKREPETHTNNGGYANRSEAQGLQSSGGPVDFNGDGVIDPDFIVRVPGGLFLNIFEEQRERTSAIGKLEFRPTDNIDLYLETFYSELEVQSERFENLHRWINATGIDPGGQTEIVTLTDANNTFNYAATIDGLGVDLRGGSRFEDRKGSLTSISAGGEFRGDHWTISGEVSTTDSTQLGNNLNIADIARGSIFQDASLHPDAPGVEYQDGFEEGRLDPNNFQIASLNGGFRRRLNDDLFDARLDFERATELEALKAIKFGFKYSQRAQDRSNGRLVIGGAAFSDLVGGLAEGPGGPGTFSAAPFMQLIEPGNGRFLDSFGGHSVFPNSWLGSDTKSFLEDYTEEELIAAGSFTNSVTGIVDVEEDVFASYGMIEFGSSDGVISGNFGLRYVATDQTSQGNAPDITRITFEPEAGAVTTIPPGEDVSVNRSYSNLLPSANLRMDVSDDVVLRFAASRTMSRPSLTQITPIATANGNSQTITRQNPMLDPFLSNNFDLSASWFLGNDGLFSVTGFYKDIVSLIRNESTQVDLPINVLLSDGTSFIENREFTVNEPVNGEGVNVKGFEFAYQHSLSFLPIDGFGFLANYTYIDNSDPTQLTAASENNYNLSGYYEKDKISFRLSYTWRDGFLTAPGSATADGTLRDAFGVLDGNFTYDINEKFSVVFEAINILDEAVVQRTLTGIPTSYSDSGRRILVGLKTRF